MENPVEAQSCLSCGAVLPRVRSARQAASNAARTAVPAPGTIGYSFGALDSPYQTELDVDENSSGWGYARPAPAWTGGWSFAGAVPFGLFALYNGMHVYGLAGILLSVFGLPLILLLWPFSIGYIVYLGFKGRELAWRGRRFADRREYEQAMRSWNIAGAWSLLLVVVLYVLWAALFVNSVDVTPLLAPGAADPSCYT
jgi:hypothetical protein